jgi:hypothetical protein
MLERVTACWKNKKKPTYKKAKIYRHIQVRQKTE